ncbi:MAG: HDOD domain-containing protein, partial [Gammaproteobacteria bacterium]|nr:HDOD domain-containing protein [Gammaproteobacteria bacterium]NIR94260.1 HDOD domain-containing protein [Gammaproteobacteria bacterium]NIX57908.1 HDOD domain-containing protein [candidate division Zixibacteria bacterium]
MNFTVESIIRKVVTIVSLPDIYVRLDKAIQNDAANRDIARIISEDAGIAARLLRIANSPFYG